MNNLEAMRTLQLLSSWACAVESSSLSVLSAAAFGKKLRLQQQDVVAAWMAVRGTPRSMHGEYVCVATQEKGSDPDIARLLVLYEPCTASFADACSSVSSQYPARSTAIHRHPTVAHRSLLEFIPASLFYAQFRRAKSSCAPCMRTLPV